MVYDRFMGKLLEAARAVKSGKINREQADLAVAWAFEEIDLDGVSAALKVSGGALYVPLARGLRDAIRLGIIVRAVGGRKK